MNTAGRKGWAKGQPKGKGRGWGRPLRAALASPPAAEGPSAAQLGAQPWSAVSGPPRAAFSRPAGAPAGCPLQAQRPPPAHLLQILGEREEKGTCPRGAAGWKRGRGAGGPSHLGQWDPNKSRRCPRPQHQQSKDRTQGTGGPRQVSGPDGSEPQSHRNSTQLDPLSAQPFHL